MVRTGFAWALVVCGVIHADVARAQSNGGQIEVGVQVASALSGQFDAADTGLGGRVSWRPRRFLGLEAELNVFPTDFPDPRPFSRGRLEGLFGATAGVAFDRIRPFARVRSGFVTVQ